MFILPSTIEKAEESASSFLGRDSKLFAMFQNCFTNTLETTTRDMGDNRYFIFTGDIPAMWLRDSSAQINHYIPYANEDGYLRNVIEGLLRKQYQCIITDPYANSYNQGEEGYHYGKDQTLQNPCVWERKYEVDSLCSPIRLAYKYWKATGRIDHLNSDFLVVANIILDLWILEQRHEQSSYRFERPDDVETDTLKNGGRGTPVGYTGMTWSGFRPSDDACAYGYLIPSNMFASVVLGFLEEIARDIYCDAILEKRCRSLKHEIQRGIEEFGIVEHPEFGRIFAYEVDGLGHYNLMDDANVPSLLSLPYIGYCGSDDPVYRNTRRFILSGNNPYYFSGSHAKGIGSPHTPAGYIWHISLIIQGLTSADQDEIKKIWELLETTDGGTLYMHEGFHADNPGLYTRKWFAWANSLFSEFVLTEAGKAPAKGRR